MNKQLGILKKIKNIRDVWDTEDRDFTPWLAEENSQRKEKKYIGIVHSMTFGLDHGVTISIDSKGTDWTAYLGG